jgi:acetyl-CoA carboxylase biotin carboxyl carrier protein
MSRRPVIEAMVKDGDVGNGELLVVAPSVGTYGFAPRVGEVLVGGSRAGRLTTLDRTSELVLPSGVTGRVAERLCTTRSNPVEYGEVLLRLVPVKADGVGEGVVSAAEAAAKDLPEGTFAVTSPTHGMFYRRPGPDAPAYVEVGSQVEQGARLALVEVMKCFSAITYGGGSLPTRAEIVEIRAQDTSEVAADEILFVVKPA